MLLDSALAAYRQCDVVTARRSGITVGGQVGKHLRMHPATVVTAKFPEVRQQTSVGLVCSMPLKAKMASSEACTTVSIRCSCPCPCRSTYVVQEDGPILGWDGAIMSTFSSEAADWEQSGYGPLLATPSVRV